MALTKYEKQVQALVDQMFIDISHTPGGYMYLLKLPKKGRSSKAALRLRWRKACMHVMFPPALHDAMIGACLTDDGRTDKRGIGLVHWLLQHLYLTPDRLFEVWQQHRHDTPPPS